MDKNKLIKIKKRLLALGLTGVILGTTGCASNKDENGIPKIFPISSEYSNIEDYYKYAIQSGKQCNYITVQMYICFSIKKHMK